MRVIKAWRMSPEQFRNQSVDDQALMIACELFESTVSAYRDQWRDEQREKSKGKHSAEDEFKAMQRRMGMKE